MYDIHEDALRSPLILSLETGIPRKPSNDAYLHSDMDTASVPSVYQARDCGPRMGNRIST